MKFLTMVKSAETGEMPPQALMDAIMAMGIEHTQKGTMLQTGGLAPTAMGVRVALRNGKITVLDGPFSEAKEVVGGWAMFEFATLKEATDMSVKFMDLHRVHWPGWEGETEIRQVFEEPDFGKKG